MAGNRRGHGTSRARSLHESGGVAYRSGVPLVSAQRLLAGVRPLRLDTMEASCAGLQISPAVVVTRAIKPEAGECTG